MEGGSQVFDQLAEIHTLVSNIIEDGFVAVALILHITDFHVQPQVLCYLTALNHGTVLTSLGLVVFIHVNGFGNTVDALNVISRFQVGLFHLQAHQTAGQRHHADIVTGIGLNSHNVAFLQVQVVHIVVVTLAGILKLNLHQVGALGIARHIGQPVVGVQLVILPATSTSAQATVAACHDFQFHIFVVHIVVISVLRVLSFSNRGRRTRFYHWHSARCRECIAATVR